MKQYLMGKKVVCRGLYTGTYYGTIVDVSDDFKVIRLENAVQFYSWDNENVSGGLAKLFTGVTGTPNVERIEYGGGEIILFDTLEILPMDGAAQSLIESKAR